VARLLLAYAIAYGWGGVPVIWSGDELFQPNDPDWASEEGHAADNRWAHRPRLDRSLAAARDDPSSDAGRVFAGLRHLGAVRASLPHLDASVPAEVLATESPSVLAVLRRHPIGPFLQLYNVSASPCPFPVRRLAEWGLAGAVDVLDDVAVPADGDLWLPPYARLWLVSRATAAP
jgi:amylosucrase